MKYAITIERFFYGPTTKLGLVTEQDGQGFQQYDSRANALDEIRRRENETYYLSHNESGGPTYKVVQVGSISFRRAFRHQNGGMEFKLLAA